MYIKMARIYGAGTLSEFNSSDNARNPTEEMKMKPEHKARIGQRCSVEFEGKTHHGTITDVVESIVKPHPIILHCIRLDNGIRLGRKDVILEDTDENLV